MLSSWIRWLAFGIGALIMLGGFAAASTGGSGVVAGVEAIILGAAFMIVAVLQRSRYRSDSADLKHEEPGPGGGEDALLEPRFLPTNEVFVDPTSRRRMRVFVDPGTGERRYRAEG
jgi:hypothetical protein